MFAVIAGARVITGHTWWVYSWWFTLWSHFNRVCTHCVYNVYTESNNDVTLSDLPGVITLGAMTDIDQQVATSDELPVSRSSFVPPSKKVLIHQYFGFPLSISHHPRKTDMLTHRCQHLVFAEPNARYPFNIQHNGIQKGNRPVKSMKNTIHSIVQCYL